MVGLVVDMVNCVCSRRSGRRGKKKGKRRAEARVFSGQRPASGGDLAGTAAQCRARQVGEVPPGPTGTEMRRGTVIG